MQKGHLAQADGGQGRPPEAFKEKSIMICNLCLEWVGF